MATFDKQMRIYNHFKSSLIGINIICMFIGCDGNEGKFITYYESGEVQCEYSIDSLGLKNGAFTCYHITGNIKETGFYRKDSVLTLENSRYYDAHPKEIARYRFYNPSGEITFERYYNPAGDIRKEWGEIVSYMVIPSDANIGDSLELQLYLASPPGLRHDVYTVDHTGRYKKFSQTKYPYLFKHSLVATKKCRCSLPFEIDVYDSLTGKSYILNDEFIFNISDKTN